MYFYCLNKTNSRTTFGNYDYFQFILVSAFLPTEIHECPNHQRFSKNRDIDLKTAVSHALAQLHANTPSLAHSEVSTLYPLWWRCGEGACYLEGLNWVLYYHVEILR